MTLHGRVHIFRSPGAHVAAKFMFAYQACVRDEGLTHLTFLKEHGPGPGGPVRAAPERTLTPLFRPLEG